MLGVQGRQQFSPRFTPLLWVLVLSVLGHAMAADLESDLQAIDQLQDSLFSRLTEEQRSVQHPEVANLAKQYQALIGKHIDDPKAHAARARFLLHVGQLQEARKEWETAHRLEPSNAETVHQLAECTLGLRDINSGLRWLEQAVELRPQSALYHFNLGNAYFLFRSRAAKAKGIPESAILKEALDHLRRSTELAPENAEFARGYAETFYGMANPDWESALSAWEHYSQVTGDTAFAAPHLARAQLKLGRFSQAREALIPLKDGSKLKQLLERKISAAEQAQKAEKPAGQGN